MSDSLSVPPPKKTVSGLIINEGKTKLVVYFIRNKVNPNQPYVLVGEDRVSLNALYEDYKVKTASISGPIFSFVDFLMLYHGFTWVDSFVEVSE